MSLRFQETCCSSQVLKSWRLDQEKSEEVLFIKTRQISQQILAFENKCWNLTEARQKPIYRDLWNQNFQIWFLAHSEIFEYDLFSHNPTHIKSLF